MAKSGVVKKNRRVLVLDDSELRSRFLSDQLSESEVQVLRDPVAAVEALKNARYDLIFLDYDLTSVPSQTLVENGTGIFVAKRLSQTINKSTPVVVHSMNIRAAEYMVGLMGNAVMIPFNRLREELERDGPRAFLQRILKKE